MSLTVGHFWGRGCIPKNKTEGERGLVFSEQKVMSFMDSPKAINFFKTVKHVKEKNQKNTFNCASTNKKL